MTHFTTSLVIGGTGMLAGATTWLAARSGETLLVARRASSFGITGGHVVALDADWGRASFEAVVAEAVARMPPTGAALLWLHEPDAVLRWLLPMMPSARVVLVLGSMDGRPQVPDAAAKIATVRLGSVRTASGRRWLTHGEISAGAISALEDGESRVVGDLADIG